jgi:3-methyladenine DNA glycosylase AlkD
MTLDETLAELEALGTEQNRKIYARHGAVGEMYGVSFANLGILRKKIKMDHQLAKGLWETGNYDARIFATMIADPSSFTAKEIDAWVKDLNCYALVDAFSKLVVQTTFAQSRMEKWVRTKGEWTASAGWNLVSHLAMHDAEKPDSDFEPLIQTIEDNIHESQNRVRYAMNMAMISIGIYRQSLRTQVLEAGKRIGTVEVDHGETSCETPDIVQYIKKTIDRQRKKSKQK